MKRETKEMHVNIFIFSCIVSVFTFSCVLDAFYNSGFAGIKDARNLLALIFFIASTGLLIYLCKKYEIRKKWDQLDKEEGL